MSYIIVWRNCHNEPFVDTGSNNFIEKYSTYEAAKEEAEQVQNENSGGHGSNWFFDYGIYKEVKSNNQ